MKNNNNQGHGERGTSATHARRAESRLERLRARAIEEMAEKCGRARARRIEAWEVRTLSASTIEEIVAIYRAEMIRALARCGQVVEIGRLFERRKMRNGASHYPQRSNPYSFAVRRAWVGAIYRAAKYASRESYSAHRVADQSATMADLVRLREWSAGNWGEARGVEVVESSALARGTQDFDAGAHRVSARQVAHARECLVAHWGLSQSRRWKSALVADLQLLADCVRIARGEGAARLGEFEGAFWASSQCRQINRMRKRIASGDALLTDRPDESETVVETWVGIRRKKTSRAARAVEMSDCLLVS